ncbi:uncharacterized protein Z519_09175 [Cladophialophora bantiana CBS 173.52]|uniref:Uncharacterized protein n=1 Tax=Cladophialophora bantiana (strain ATCC 10958 / CBS 173.52 / CDC B-1940 / NIH 8579) TaxID=1442370 RepID=A0A0D2HBE3_CLAB1|nr:uncharacterized protein Z519_09175 [Cladophialophora bantiana CBS 173.52]KIW90528.1 hypothetical protein Z519_09175 [Cladophialophora bantiana CBS 173.52]
MASASISTELLERLKSFNGLLARDDLFKSSSGIPKCVWNDELGRLRVWAANIGAHQKDQSSLDYRLRNASHIKSEIINLLQSLKMTLQDLEEILVEFNEKCRADDDDDDGREAEVAEIFNDMVQVITNLYRMSILVRQPSQQDRFLRYQKDDAAGYEPFDRNHVREKFPDADSIVVDRLGRAISNRCRHLKALARHRAKLGKGISHVHVETHDGVSTVISGTLATDYDDRGPIAKLESESVSGESTTSYAASFLVGKKSIRVPLPLMGYGNEQQFECPYCFLITTTNSRKSWARHVFRDLMPYICIFPDCSTPSKIKIERHLAEHLEELALFALPPDMQDDDEDREDDNDDQKNHFSTAGSDISSHSDDGDLPHEDPAGSVKSNKPHSPVEGVKGDFALPKPQLLDSDDMSLQCERQPHIARPAVPRSSSVRSLPTTSFIDNQAFFAQFMEAEGLKARAVAPPESKFSFLTLQDPAGWLCSFPLIINHANHQETLKAVANGRYYLIGSNDEIISPETWESIVKPDTLIRLRFNEQNLVPEAPDRDEDRGRDKRDERRNEWYEDRKDLRERSPRYRYENRPSGPSILVQAGKEYPDQLTLVVDRKPDRSERDIKEEIRKLEAERRELGRERQYERDGGGSSRLFRDRTPSPRGEVIIERRREEVLEVKKRLDR